MTSAIKAVQQTLRQNADPTKEVFLLGFFKVGKPGYPPKDQFLGITVPKLRQIAKQFHGQLSLSDTSALLRSLWHDERLVALYILVLKFEKGDQATKQKIVNFYLTHTKHVDHWDLVDSSAYQILGTWLTDKDRSLLYKLAKSANWNERRLAMVATYAFLRRGEVADTLRLSELLLKDSHDYIHKAVGWMLREAGKRDRAALLTFLDTHSAHMPRTALRYAIEHLDPSTRLHYLKLKPQN